jgi:hypothetical protein
VCDSQKIGCFNLQFYSARPTVKQIEHKKKIKKKIIKKKTFKNFQFYVFLMDNDIIIHNIIELSNALNDGLEYIIFGSGYIVCSLADIVYMWRGPTPYFLCLLMIIGHCNTW